MADNDGDNENLVSKVVLSMDQAILAPLDAIAKAQTHAARSFLNLLFQIGYPHIPIDSDGNPKYDDMGERKKSYTFDCHLKSEEGKLTKISVPTLAMVPIQPLAIDSVDFSVELKVVEIAEHRQIQSSEAKSLEKEGASSDLNRENGDLAKARPWYLVDNPVSFRGHLGDGSRGSGQQNAGSSESASVKVNIKMTRAPIPDGLEKLLAAMTHRSTSEEVDIK